jgi:acetyltransferase
LTGVEAAEVLSAHGIPFIAQSLAKNEAEAVQAAQSVGFPVALKLNSEVVTHKTEARGVELNVATPEAVRRAFRAIEQACLERAGAAAFAGCVVQPMISRQGYELIVGSSVDPQLGPVLLFGSGGQLVEVFQDYTLDLPPLNGTLARLMIERTKIHKALRGVRGRKPLDMNALEALLIRFSELVVTQPRIAEVEINPLLASEQGLIALDARVVLHPPSVPDQQLPRSAIRPYPAQYSFEGQLRDGTPVLIRPIRAEDEPRLARFHQGVSDTSVYLRYFEPFKIEQRMAHEHLSRSCCIDYDREIVLIAQSRKAEEGEILAMAKLTKLSDAKTAEFALLVGDPWQGQGLGSQLLKYLVQIAGHEGLERIVGVTLASNSRMRHVARQCGFEQSADPAGGEYDLKLELRAAPGRRDGVAS